MSTELTLKQKKLLINSVLFFMTVTLGITLVLAVTALLQTAPGRAALNGANALFAADSTQIWWYVTRSAGIIAYLLLWLSTVWGLAVPSKLLNPMLADNFTFDFHEFISLLALGFTLLHVSVLMVDRYLPYNLAQILIPFLSPYRPFWVGLGILAFYISLLVTVTFYMRARIGSRAFRSIHTLSLLGYLGVTLHGLYAGTDSPLAAMQLLYKGSALVVVFLTVYWLALKYQQSQETKKKALATRLHHKHSAQRNRYVSGD